jgi:hypothetical protein
LQGVVFPANHDPCCFLQGVLFPASHVPFLQGGFLQAVYAAGAALTSSEKTNQCWGGDALQKAVHLLTAYLIGDP